MLLILSTPRTKKTAAVRISSNRSNSLQKRALTLSDSRAERAEKAPKHFHFGKLQPYYSALSFGADMVYPRDFQRFQ